MNQKMSMYVNGYSKNAQRLDTNANSPFSQSSILLSLQMNTKFATSTGHTNAEIFQLQGFP